VGVRAATCHDDECGQQHASHACWARSNMWALTASVHDVCRWENCCKDNERSDNRWPQLIKSAAGTVSRRSRSTPPLHACCEHRQSLLHFHSPSDRRCLAAKTEADGECLDRGNKRLVDEVWHLWTRPPKRGDVDHCAASWSAKAMSESEFLNSNVHTPHPHSAKPQQAPQQRKFQQRGFEENATVCACVVRAAAS